MHNFALKYLSFNNILLNTEEGNFAKYVAVGDNIYKQPLGTNRNPELECKPNISNSPAIYENPKGCGEPAIYADPECDVNIEYDDLKDFSMQNNVYEAPYTDENNESYRTERRGCDESR